MLRSLTVLIADDNHLFRKTLCEFVESLGNIKVVGEALDGNQAIELAQKLHPDIVLTDVHMPKKNGFEASLEIKKMCPEIFLIIITLHDAPLYQSLAKDCLADAFVSKHEMKELGKLILPLFSNARD